MEEDIAFDSHKHYTWVEHEKVSTREVRVLRVPKVQVGRCYMIESGIA